MVGLWQYDWDYCIQNVHFMLCTCAAVFLALSDHLFHRSISQWFTLWYGEDIKQRYDIAKFVICKSV